MKLIKNNITTILVVVALFLFSFDKATSLITSRSKKQIIVHSNNPATVINRVNELYTQGYRVTCGLQAEEYNEIIIIMEK